MCPLARCAPAHTQEERERREGGREGERCALATTYPLCSTTKGVPPCQSRVIRGSERACGSSTLYLLQPPSLSLSPLSSLLPICSFFPTSFFSFPILTASALHWKSQAPYWDHRAGSEQHYQSSFQSLVAPQLSFHTACCWAWACQRGPEWAP